MIPAEPTSQDSLCIRLRRERERRQIALSSISANTKISVSLFEALERGDVSRWPSGIYRRAFVRAYAQGIGLDPDSVAREFLEHFPDTVEPQPAVEGTPPAPAAAAVDPPPPSPAQAVVRLKLGDAGKPFMPGCLLAGMRDRWAAAACDAGVVVGIALCVFIACGTFWLPLGIATLAYYLGGILLLGNTPGVCLWAPGGAAHSHYNRPSDASSRAGTPPRAHSHWRLRVPAR